MRPLTVKGARCPQRFPKLKQLQLRAPFLDSGICLISHSSALSFAPEPAWLPGQHHVCVNLAVLEGLASLKELTLQRAYIHSVSQLEALSQLQHLLLDACSFKLADTSPIGKQYQPALQTLHVRCSEEPALTPQKELPNLQQTLLLNGVVPSMMHTVSQNKIRSAPG